MRGRKPTPTHLKLVKGTARKDRANKNEPKPKRVKIDPPDHISDKARAIWPRVHDQLHGTGILTSIDAIALERLCETYADIHDAQETLKAFGDIYYPVETKSGGVMYRAHPAYAALADADRRIRSWLSEFGMTPSSRSKVSALPAEGDDPADKYFPG